MKFPLNQPAIVGSIITPGGLRMLARAKLPADAVEVRVDALLVQKTSLAKIEAALRGRRHPVLLTLRLPAEGGHRPWKRAERRDLFLRLLPLVEAIDIELASLRNMSDVLAEAGRLDKTVILSAHALKAPGTPAQFQKWRRQHDDAPGAILKIASLIKSWRDLQRLAALLVNQPDRSLAVMGVGPHASQSRMVLAALGSRLVYGYLDQPAAPGQPSANSLRKTIQA